MIYYFIMISLPALLSMASSVYINRLFFHIYFIVLIAFLGLRYEVGTDWVNYLRIHFNLSYVSFSEAIAGVEPLSNGVMWVSQWLGFGILGTNVIAAVVFLSGIFAFAKTQENQWLALVAAMPFLIFVVGMSATRQAMAIGVAYFALARWDNLAIRSRVFIILTAGMFHLSAAFILVFVPVASGLRRSNKLLLVILGLTLPIFSLTQISDLVSQYQNYYVGRQDAIIAGGVLFHLALVCAPALVFLAFYHRLAPHTVMPELVLYGSLAAVLLLFMIPFSTVIASRLANYLYFVSMAVSSASLKVFSPPDRIVVAALLAGLNILVLFSWMSFANNAIDHRDYQSIFALF